MISPRRVHRDLKEHWQNLQHEDQQDLTRGQPEFSLAIGFDSKHIEQSIQDYTRSTDSSDWYVVSPEREDEIECSDFERDKERCRYVSKVVSSQVYSVNDSPS